MRFFCLLFAASGLLAQISQPLPYNYTNNDNVLATVVPGIFANLNSINGKVVTGSGAPANGTCASVASPGISSAGTLYVRNNAAATLSSFYVCAETASNTYAWEGPYGTGSGGGSQPFTSALNPTPSDAVCALGGDSLISGITCQGTSATSPTAFSSTVNIPAGSLSSNSIPVALSFGTIAGSGTVPGETISVLLDSVPILTGTPTTVFNVSGGNSNIAAACQITAPLAASASAPVIMSCTGAGTAFRNQLLSSASPLPYVLVNTSIAHSLKITIAYLAATQGNAIWLQSITGFGGGPVGPQGLQGAVGATGPQGIQGVQGVTGSQGIQGVTGSTGSTGSLGDPVSVATSKTLASGDNFTPQEICGSAITISAPASLTGLLAIGWSVPLRNIATVAGCTPSGVTVSGNGNQICGSLSCASSQTLPAYAAMALAINAAGTGYDLVGWGPAGATGAAGPSGSNGATGATGPQGATGAAGPTGSGGGATVTTGLLMPFGYDINGTGTNVKPGTNNAIICADYTIPYNTTSFPGHIGGFTFTGTGYMSFGIIDPGGNVIANTGATPLNAPGEAQFYRAFGSAPSLTGGSTYGFCLSSTVSSDSVFSVTGDGNFGQIANQGATPHLYTCANSTSTTGGVTTWPSVCGTKTGVSTPSGSFAPYYALLP